MSAPALLYLIADGVCCHLIGLCSVPYALVLHPGDSAPASNQPIYSHFSFVAKTHKKYFSCHYFLAWAVTFISGQDSEVKQ